MAGTPPKDGRDHLVLHAGAALMRMSARYWLTLAPLIRREMADWRHRAQQIPDPTLRALALQKLHGESLNVALAPTFATLTPRQHRQPAARAIVALQIIYDYLDGLGEQPTPDPLRSGHQLFQALTDAVSTGPVTVADYYLYSSHGPDGGYLAELVGTVRSALAALPGTPAVAAVAQQAARRVAGAQVRVHAASHEGASQLEQWATREAQTRGQHWREFLAGAASSVIAMHALIAAAGDPRTTYQQACEIDAVYTAIGAIATMLDTVVDYERDLANNELSLSYIGYYQDRETLTQALTATTRNTAARAPMLHDGAHHFMTLLGVAAYYTSAPQARSPLAKPVSESVRRELGPLMTPILIFLRAWQLTSRHASPNPTPAQPSRTREPQAQVTNTGEQRPLTS
jgi:tetraprenyl-beta-curcumene synthase